MVWRGMLTPSPQHDFMEGDLSNASTGRIWLAITWVFVGTGLMSFLGKWA